MRAEETTNGFGWDRVLKEAERIANDFGNLANPVIAADKPALERLAAASGMCLHHIDLEQTNLFFCGYPVALILGGMYAGSGLLRAVPCFKMYANIPMNIMSDGDLAIFEYDRDLYTYYNDDFYDKFVCTWDEVILPTQWENPSEGVELFCGLTAGRPKIEEAPSSDSRFNEGDSDLLDEFLDTFKRRDGKQS